MRCVKPLDTTRVKYANVLRLYSAAYMNVNGTWVYAGSNEKRLHFVHTDEELNLGFFGVLVEPRRTNYLKNTNGSPFEGSISPAKLLGQEVNISDASHLGFVLSFRGTGSVTIEANNFTDTLQGVSFHEYVERWYSRSWFNQDATLTFTVNGDVWCANFEGTGFNINDPMYGKRTTWIPTKSVPVTREAESVSFNEGENFGIIFNDFTDSLTIWDASIEYSQGYRVIYDNHIFQSLVSGNIGNEPNRDVEYDDFWVRVSVANTFAMIDSQTDVKATRAGAGHFSFVTKNIPITDCALLEIAAKSVNFCVAHYSSSGTEYRYFAKGEVKNILSLGFVPNTTGDFYSVFTFELNGNDAQDIVSVGELVVGTATEIGQTQYGLTASIVDFSVKKTSEFGITSIAKRGFSKRLSGSVFVDKSQMNDVMQFMYDNRSEVMLWIASKDKELEAASVILGIYNNFSMAINYPNHALYSIELEGLVI